MTPPTPRLLSGPPRWGILCALVALMAFATGGAGLAHRALAHAHPAATPGGSADAHAQTGTACTSSHAPLPASFPADAPADHDSDPHDCNVCELLASGVMPPTPPDTAPAFWPLKLLPHAALGVTPSAARVSLPPARGPPSLSV